MKIQSHKRREIVEEYNQKYFKLKDGTQLRVGQDRDENGNPMPHGIEIWDKQSFFDACRFDVEDMTVYSASGKTAGKREVERAQVWFESRDARMYYRIGVDPSPNPDPYLYNLWRGFAIEPQPGDWSLFRRHLYENVCQGTDEYYDYLIRWMARAVQMPHLQGEVAVVLRGPKGCGKSTVANTFGSLFGRHYRAISNRDHLIGRFNAHLQDTIVLLVDEGFWAGDKQGEGVLKQLITEPYIPIEAKYKDAENCPNMLHLMIASNESWVVPAKGMERRFFVLDVAGTRVKDFDFWNDMHGQLDEGGRTAMLYDLLNMDLDGYNVRMVPTTEALRDQMLHSLPPLENWWHEKLIEGRAVPNGTWSPVTKKSMYDDYCGFVKKYSYSPQQFFSELNKLLPEPGVREYRTESNKGQPGIRKVELPPLAECRRFWQEQRGIGVEWESEEGDD